MFLECGGEDVGFPVLRQSLDHELLLGLWGEPADGWVAVEISGEGVALGTGGDGV